jgi:phycocyanin-associated rod protein
MKVSATTRSTGINSERQVSITVTGMNNIDYSRTADMVMNVPFTRMRETMHLVHCMGGKITSVNVSGSGSEGGGSPNPAPRKPQSKTNPED